MKINWSGWDIGGKIIFSATCVAVISFLLPWVDIGIVSLNGITQGTILFGLFFIYPVLKLLNDQNIDKILGILCGGVSILFTIIYISSQTRDMIFSDPVNISSVGAHLFLLASIALVIGVLTYKKNEIND